MSKFWRIVLAWWLAVALPIQGYAAQTLLLCGPASQAGQGGSVAMAPADMAHEHPAALSADEHAHAHDDAAFQAHEGGDAGQDPDVAAPHEHGKHAGKCSVSASCCSAVALVSSIVTIPVVHPDLLDVPTVKLIRDRVAVGGLERPPRSPSL